MDIQTKAREPPKPEGSICLHRPTKNLLVTVPQRLGVLPSFRLLGGESYEPDAPVPKIDWSSTYGQSTGQGRTILSGTPERTELSLAYTGDQQPFTKPRSLILKIGPLS